MRIHKVSQLSLSYSLTVCNMITDADLFPNLKTYLWQQLNSVLHFNETVHGKRCARSGVYSHDGGKRISIDLPIQSFLDLVSVGQLMVDQLIVGTTRRTALCLSLVKPEPHNSSVVFLTCRKLYKSSTGL